jgi:hypothetical protein
MLTNNSSPRLWPLSSKSKNSLKNKLLKFFYQIEASEITCRSVMEATFRSVAIMETDSVAFATKQSNLRADFGLLMSIFELRIFF